MAGKQLETLRPTGPLDIKRTFIRNPIDNGGAIALKLNRSSSEALNGKYPLLVKVKESGDTLRVGGVPDNSELAHQHRTS